MFSLEHVTAVTVSVKDKLNLSLGVAVGSSIVSSIVQYAKDNNLITCVLHSKLLFSSFRRCYYGILHITF